MVGPLLLIPFCLTAVPDSWSAPRARLYVSNDHTIALKVVPTKVPDKFTAVGTLYELDYDGREHVLWQKEFSHIPVRAFVHSRDRVVTTDTYGNAGYEHALVIYGRKGEVVAEYHLDRLLTAEERQQTVSTISSRWWLKPDGVLFKDSLMKIPLIQQGKKLMTLTIDLKSGKRIFTKPKP